MNYGFLQMYGSFLVFWCPVEFYLLSGEQSEWFCYFCESSYEFPVVSYQSEEGSDWLRFVGRFIFCIACVSEGSGHMPVVLRMWPKYCISFKKKLHLLFFIEKFADLSFSNTMQMCERCSCGVLLNMMMSSR